MVKYLNQWKDVEPVYADGSVWSGYCAEGERILSFGVYCPGGWMPGIPGGIIDNYSKRGEMVLDQFVGAGTTLVEAILTNRRAIGCDINSNAVDTTRKMTKLTLEDEGIYVRKKDARRLYGIADGSIDLICTQPPYFDCIRYSEDLKGDMSIMNLSEYMKSMEKAALESYRVLRDGRYCAIMVGDIKKDGCIVPLGMNITNAFVGAGFKLKHVVINRRNEDKDSSCLVYREYMLLFAKQ